VTENRAVKDIFDSKLIADVGSCLTTTDPGFPAREFAQAANRDLECLEFKQRMQHIADALARYLPEDFLEAADLLRRAAEKTDGNAVAFWPMCRYVQDHGIEFFDDAMATLEVLTRRISAEWAVRPYLDREPCRAMNWLRRWVESDDAAVRRLVSEGTRPRLPWAPRFKEFGSDPATMLPLLEKLRDDPDEVVRRSVANHLNDISKDRPEWVVRQLARWNRDASKQCSLLIRHALRTLVKQGHTGALKILGIGPPHVNLVSLCVDPAEVKLGSQIEISFELVSTTDKEQELIIDFALHHRRANGKLARKVFKWSQRSLAPGEKLELKRKLSFQQMSTRRYHPGEHHIELIVNGESQGKTSFELQ
jgi:3-methyladenine DNA glycosylase AlkC